MKKLLLILLAAGSTLAFSTIYFANDANPADREAVEELVLKSYVNGAFNRMDYEEMTKGFHEDFAIFTVEGEKLGRYEIEDWVNNIKKRREDPSWKAEENVWEHKFPTIDITDTSAMVKVELSKNGKHIFTDYLSLLKFETGWKIVGKVYTRHN